MPGVKGTGTLMHEAGEKSQRMHPLTQQAISECWPCASTVEVNGKAMPLSSRSGRYSVSSKRKQGHTIQNKMPTGVGEGTAKREDWEYRLRWDIDRLFLLTSEKGTLGCLYKT